MAESLLPRDHPELCPTAEQLADCTERLSAAYQEYTTRVSPAYMAMSLEACSYILFAAEQIKPASAVDFGSGFTSYVLRTVCDDVWSVDDSPVWLDWTESFLRRHGQHHGQLCVWDDYRHQTHTHDLVVYDFSSGPTRDENFQFAIGQLEPGGLAILDDANHGIHQKSMARAAIHFHYDLYGLQDWTRDAQKRFAALVIAP